ncbi:MAG TPA: PQQ-binding-like beta-propeller repeat protein [Planctomycetota bacterium]
MIALLLLLQDHSFLATGGETHIVEKGQVTWTYPASTRDGWVVDGRILLALSKSKAYPGGAAVEVDRSGKILWEYKGTQAEVDTLQLLPNGNMLLTEAGPKPRLLEITREGKTAVEIALGSQTGNPHMQQRMSRKTDRGYLVPHLLDRVIREYAPDGKTLWEVKTPDEPKECWPFTAIRLPDGNTLASLTHGNRVAEFDKDGKIAWLLTNADLPSPLLKDPCGVQRLPNGNTVICSYGAGGADEVKLLEVTRDKKLVWTYKSGKAGGIHHAQILDVDGPPLR